MGKSSTKLTLRKPNKNDLTNAKKTNNTTSTFNTTNSVSTYKPGKNVTNAYGALQKQLNNKVNFNSNYTNEMNNAYNNYKNRKPFEYDMNNDALYQQYAKQYKALGNTAMQDTMGQAAQLSGGFGNSYAASAGQQTYNQYMQQLNDKVPELYAQAYDKYNQEGQDLLNQYNLAEGLYNRDYSKYRDAVADNNEKIAQLYNIYNTNAGNDLDLYKQLSTNNFNALDYNLNKQNQLFNQKMQQAQLDLDRQKTAADIEATRANSASKILSAKNSASKASDIPKQVYSELEKRSAQNKAKPDEMWDYLDYLEDKGLITTSQGQKLFKTYWPDYTYTSRLDEQLTKEGALPQSYALDNHLKALAAQDPDTYDSQKLKQLYKKYRK